MRRRTWHLLFGAVALACASAVAVNALRWWQVQETNRAIVAASRQAVGPNPSPAPNDAPREVRLARALALAEAGAYDAAFKAYSALIRPEAPDAIGRQALYNLGNMHLRQGTTGEGSAPAAMPMIELAKQRYRDLLRAAPEDWDARYNLERAVRLAPEEHPLAADDENGPRQYRRVRLPAFRQVELP